MKKLLTIAAVAAALVCGTEASAQYYKDLFMDGGINITSRVDLPSARYLGISWERYYSAKHSPMELSMKDTVEQTAILVGSEIDANGRLLYPDGAPRFRAIYVNGGKAGKHGNSLTEVGRNNIRAYVKNGGSYIGTCAGAFVSSIADTEYDKSYGTDQSVNLKKAKCVAANDTKVREEYFGIYPARTISTSGLLKVATDMKLPAKSPLLKYFDFGGDKRIDSVYHNGGCFITENPAHFAPGTEILMYYIYDKDQARIKKGRFAVTGKISAWAWKENDFTGRIVDCGSHPEGVVFGERLQLFSSFILYAMDGNGKPVVKGELLNGEARQMTKKTEDNDPAYTRIGDKQYHHFTVNIPKGAKDIEVSLKCDDPAFEGDDLYLTMKKGDFAFAREADHANVQLGTDKSLKFETIESGLWYIGVMGATTVDAVQSDHGEEYTGHLEVLNGVPYTITVSWK